MCLEIYGLDSAYFLFAPVLTALSTDIDMFLIVEKVIRGRICHTIH